MPSWFLGYLFILPVLCFNTKNNRTNSNCTTTPEYIHFLNLDQATICKFQPNGHDCDGTGWSRQRFYYDLKLEDCKTSSIGNCPFNLNTFTTLSDCHNTCRDVGAKPVPAALAPRIFCRLQFDFGRCNSYHPSWYYDVTIRRCRGFSYSGCGGNRNRFRSQQACSTACSGVK
ncbi:kunitz-type serine protease inhibitor bitisilin-3-like [Maniola jurtina]|uniref:kunitz-type serine protease inhibitor bitisilin-3-like n=1 Tax=Maniola jurtina TaxID=191418 RepID=UPI001E68A484|nr:kunitz-type serine protease inhibitor bitisilin-3-like [Maniola jurtina]